MAKGNRKFSGSTNWAMIRRAFVIVAFLLVIWLPLIGKITSLGQTKVTTENKTFAKKPVFVFSSDGIKSYFPAYDDYYSQSFGFRAYFVHWYSLLLATKLHVSPCPKVILGKDNWLFYNGEQNENIIDNYYRGINLFTDEELAKMTKELQRRQAFANKRGAKFLFVIAPDKHSIYPEYLPSYVNKISQKTRVDQLVEYVRSHSDVAIISLREEVLNGKKQGRKLYFSNDTHWNDLGAYYGYLGIMSYLKKWFGIYPLSLRNYQLKEEVCVNSDLSSMLNLPEYYQDKDYYLQRESFCHREPLNFAATPGVSASWQPFAMNCSGKRLRLVMIHDSFTQSLVPLLAPHFKRAAFIWRSSFEPKIINSEKPDLVIQEMVERLVGRLLEPGEY